MRGAGLAVQEYQQGSGLRRRRRLTSKPPARASGIRLGIGLSLAVAAQILLITLPERILPRSQWLLALQPVWPHTAPVVVAIGLFVLAVALSVPVFRPFFGAEITGVGPTQSTSSEPVTRHKRDRFAVIAISASIVLQILIATGLATTPYDPWYGRGFGLAVLLLVAGLAWYDRSRLTFRLPRRVTLDLGLEVGGVAALVASLTWLSYSDLRSWFFGIIGDEYPFYEASHALATGASRNLFSQRGVYDIIPVLSSYVEGVQMRLFGLDLVGWKFSIITQVAVALIFTYLLARSLFGRRVAILTLGFLATSHYLLAYVHTGYANIETLLPAVAAFWLFVIGQRRGSIAALVVAGMFAGLGWYTFYPSRTAIGILGVAVVLTVPLRRWFSVGLPLLGGFATLFLPLLVVNKAEVITIMLDQSGQGGTAEAAANRALLPYWNIGRSLLAFNYNPHKGPFLLGSLLEPTTATLFVLGLGFAIATWRDKRSRFLLTWFTIGIVATGVLSKYDYVSVSRLNFLLPLTTLLAALAADRILDCCVPARATPRGMIGSTSWKFWSIANPVVAVGIVAILSMSTYGNLHRWFVEMPSKTPSTPDTMILQFIVAPRCQLASQVPLIVDASTSGELVEGLKARSSSLAIPKYVTYKDPSTWIETANSRCVLFRSPRHEEALALANKMRERWPAADTAYMVDGSGETFTRIFYPESHG